MTTVDYFLAAWWVLTIVTSVCLVAISKIAGKRDRELTIRTALVQGKFEPYKTPLVAFLPRPLGIPLIVLLAILVIGLFAFFWMSGWSWLLQLNGRLWMIAYCLFALYMAVWPRAFQRIRNDNKNWPRWQLLLLRLGSIALGAGGIWLAWVTTKDLRLPTHTVTGRVNWISTYGGITRMNFDVAIDDRTYRALRSAISCMKTGDMVDLEITAGTNTAIERHC